MSNPHKLFETYLIDNDSRYTAQKKSISNEIFKTKGHFEVEVFIDHLRAKDQSFSRATVYRTIKQLLDAGLLQKISTKEGKVFYEQTRQQKQHAHVICNTCGAISEIKDNVIESYINDHCQRIHFSPEYLSLHVYGICQKCQNKVL